MSDAVADLLNKNGVYFRVSGKDYVTNCFNPAHTDTNPSFRIDKISGIAHCFSCGWKMNIFKHYGVLTTNNVSIKIAKLKEKLHELNISTNGLPMLDSPTPFNETYRNIKASTFKEFGAFTTEVVEGMDGRVIFPLTDVRGKTVAFIGRHKHHKGNLRYNNYPSGVSLPLFPARFDKQYTNMVLVEGIFDMLNLYDKGVHNVVCTFGTSKLYNDASTKMQPYKVMGINKVYIMFDGDTAGREAAIKLKPILEEAEFLVEIVELPDDQDPGGFSQEDVTSIYNYINNKESNEDSSD